jgi:hypothetical protein
MSEGSETAGEPVVIHESEILECSRSAWDFPFAVARLLKERGIRCGVRGVHGQILDTEYRIELDPPYRVEHNRPEAAWLVWQGPSEVNQSIAETGESTN